jgi:cupin fold WbuC family metalloprotein
MTLIQKSPEVFVAEGPIAAIGQADIDILRFAVKSSPKKRARINAHCNDEDTLHEMIIAIDAKSYIHPHRHPGKSEAFHIVEGEVDIVVFAENGDIDRVVELGAPGSGRAFYYRMSDAFFHTLIIRSDVLIVHEITNGPFRLGQTEFADFAPKDTDTDKAESYMADVARRVASLQRPAR